MAATPARQHRGRTFCAECDEMVRYRRDVTGEWICTVCGFAIDCVECGQTLHKNHHCPTEETQR